MKKECANCKHSRDTCHSRDTNDDANGDCVSWRPGTMSGSEMAAKLNELIDLAQSILDTYYKEVPPC